MKFYESFGEKKKHIVSYPKPVFTERFLSITVCLKQHMHVQIWMCTHLALREMHGFCIVGITSSISMDSVKPLNRVAQ